MSGPRAPLVGYNHNVSHLGWDFHIQTEDSGTPPHIVTHLFHGGTILATRKLVYDPGATSEFVKDLMQAQHKSMLRELKGGRFDEQMRATLGPPPPARPSVWLSPPEDAGSTTVPPELNRVVAERSTTEWKGRPGAARPQIPSSPLPPPVPQASVKDVGTTWILRGKIKEQVAVAEEKGPEPVAAAPLRAIRARVTTEGKKSRLELGRLTPEVVQAAYFPNGSVGGLLVEPEEELGLGAPVEVRIALTGTSTGFRLKGTVAWKRKRSSGALAAGVGIELAASEEPAVRRLLSLARGEEGSAADRKHRRVNASIMVKLAEQSGERRKESAADISEGGMFVTTSRRIAVGEDVVVTLKPPGALLGGFDVKGKVAWRKEGGLGVMFVFDSDEQREKVATLVTRLRASDEKR